VARTHPRDPARVGSWALDVDDRGNPTEAIVWQNGVEVARLPYDPAMSLLERLVAETGMANGDSTQLRVQLEAKRTATELES
jgi:hypothetical protein